MAKTQKTPSKPRKKRVFDVQSDPCSAPELVESPFSTSTKRLEDLGGKEKWRHDIDLLIVEWAIKYPLMSVREFLKTMKGYSESQYIRIVHTRPASEWQMERGKILDKLTESVVKRHIDLIADVQEQHIKASKLALAKALEMLSKGGTAMIDRKTGDLRRDEKGNIVLYPMRSIDLLNCTGAIEKAQAIYRKAMGLPNEEGGLQQVLDKIQQLNVNTTNNLHLHLTGPAGEAAKIQKDLTYDQILLLIESKREQKAAAQTVVAEVVKPEEKK